MKSQTAGTRQQSPIAAAGQSRGVTQGRRDLVGTARPESLRDGPCCTGVPTHLRAGWGQAQPDPQSGSARVCSGQPPPMLCLPCRVGLRAQWIPSTFWSQTPSLSPPLPPLLPALWLACRAPLGPCTHKSTLLHSQPQSKARCPALPPPWAPPGRPAGFLSLCSHTAPCQ